MVAVLDRVQSIRAPQPARDHNLRPNYRPDIDGLRAVAILSVVAFHLSPDLLRGGFLGVDVFFVISGFLISTIIFKSLANDGFSFLEFYAHRIRRIFPGLVLVIAFCLFVGWHALLPTEFVLLGKHVIASTLFTENFRLWREAGYFDISTSLKPLMHLWSLAIEEQFYLAFPLILWVGWRLRLNLFAIVAAIFAASFAFYLNDVDHQPIAAFFSPKSRFWELMAGAILAYVSLHYADRLQAVRNIGRRDRGAAGLGVALGETAASFTGLALLAVVIGRVQPRPALRQSDGRRLCGSRQCTAHLRRTDRIGEPAAAGQRYCRVRGVDQLSALPLALAASVVSDNHRRHLPATLPTRGRCRGELCARDVNLSLC
jgi:peptidoglycan/LPS O-acetylase OafA/YrhL